MSPLLKLGMSLGKLAIEVASELWQERQRAKAAQANRGLSHRDVQHQQAQIRSATTGAARLRGVTEVKALAAVWLLGCVTRAQVCVEYSHSIGPRDAMSNDATGASVCADVERP